MGKWTSWLLELVIVVCMVAWWVLKPERWSLKRCVATTECKFRSGDLLYFLEHGDVYPHPGHLALIVQDHGRFGQWYVWEMPNPLFHAPMLLKPLAQYLQRALKKRNAMVFVQQLLGAEQLDFLPAVRKNSARAQYDMWRSLLYWNRLVQDMLGLPGLPVSAQPHRQDLQHCTDAALMPLIDLGVLRPAIRDADAVLCPTTLLAPNFDLNAFTNEPFRFEQPVRILKPGTDAAAR